MSTPLDVQLCAPARGAIAVITRMTRATAGMGPDHAPRSAVERDDFDLTQRRGRKSAKNEYNLKLPKFNRSRGAWRIAGAYIGGGHKYSCAMA
jgi:hypothetical protein